MILAVAVNRNQSIMTALKTAMAPGMLNSLEVGNGLY